MNFTYTHAQAHRDALLIIVRRGRHQNVTREASQAPGTVAEWKGGENPTTLCNLYCVSVSSCRCRRSRTAGQAQGEPLQEGWSQPDWLGPGSPSLLTVCSGQALCSAQPSPAGWGALGPQPLVGPESPVTVDKQEDATPKLFLKYLQVKGHVV